MCPSAQANRLHGTHSFSAVCGCMCSMATASRCRRTTCKCCACRTCPICPPGCRPVLPPAFGMCEAVLSKWPCRLPPGVCRLPPEALCHLLRPSLVSLGLCHLEMPSEVLRHIPRLQGAACREPLSAWCANRCAGLRDLTLQRRARGRRLRHMFAHEFPHLTCSLSFHFIPFRELVFFNLGLGACALNCTSAVWCYSGWRCACRHPSCVAV